MSRPRRSTETQIEDLFFGLDIKSQERLLTTLQTLNRLKRRQPDAKAEPRLSLLANDPPFEPTG